MYEIYSLNNGAVFCYYYPSKKTGHSGNNLLTILTNLDTWESNQSWISWIADYYYIDWKITTDSPEAFIADYPEYFI